MARFVTVALLAAVLALPVEARAAVRTQLDPPAIDIVQLSPEEQAIPPATLTPEQTASVLMEVAGRFEERGELNAARLLYREVVDRYGDTIQAARALERLTAIEGRPDYGTPLPPITPPAGTPGTPGSVERGTPPPPSTPQASTASPPGRRAGLDQSGRVSLIVYSTVMSAWVALAIPIYAQADGSPPYGLALLLGAPAGLVTSIYATRDRQVTAAQADIYVLAGNMGLWHGLAIGAIEDLEGYQIAGTTAIGGLVGVATGALLISPGRTRETAASLSGLAAPYGTWFALVLFQMLRKYNVNSGNEEGDTRLGAMLLGGDAALLGAVITESNITLSRERARLIALTGVAGGLAGGALDLLFQIKDGQAWAMVGAGTAGGLVAGMALTADYDTKRGFTDPPRAELSPATDDGPDFAVMPLNIRALPAAGPNPAHWREALRMLGVSSRPAVGVTLLEARF